MLARFSMTKKINALAILLMLLGGVLGALSLSRLSGLNAHTHELATNWLPSIESIGKMAQAAQQHRARVMRHVLNEDAAAMRGIEVEIADALRNYEQARSIYVPMISSAEEQRIYDGF